MHGLFPVSYTHLDVYKRQILIGNNIVNIAAASMFTILFPIRMVESRVSYCSDRRKMCIRDRVGTDTLESGKHVVRWAVVKSSRFDSKAFRETYPSRCV